MTVPDDLLAHVAPLGWEHIALTGDYVWTAVLAAWLNRPSAALDDVRVVTRIRGAETAAAERSDTALVGTTARWGRRGQSDAGWSGAIPV